MALPIFLHRHFGYSFVFINKSMEIMEPKNLKFKRIGKDQDLYNILAEGTSDTMPDGSLSMAEKF